MGSLNFSTQWEDENILIKAQKGVFSSYFVKVFFRNWLSVKAKPSNYLIKLKFGKMTGMPLMHTPLFDYQREVIDNDVVTYISKVNIFRALVRSFYKIIMNEADIVGIPELYMAIIRKGIIEPIEYFNYKNNWTLIHASVFNFKDKTFVISAGSKAGKSTIVKSMLKNFEIEVLSDNYCFIKGNQVRTIEEPFRGGKPRRHKLTFYNRSVSGNPKIFEGRFKHLIYMVRGNINKIEEISHKEMELSLFEINERVKEGAYYVNDEDKIKIQKGGIEINPAVNLSKLEVAEGIENIQTAIKKVTSLV